MNCGNRTTVHLRHRNLNTRSREEIDFQKNTYPSKGGRVENLGIQFAYVVEVVIPSFY